MDHTLDEALASVTAADAGVDSLIALFDVKKKALADALAGVTLSPEQQAKVNAVFDMSTADAAKTQAALVA